MIKVTFCVQSVLHLQPHTWDQRRQIAEEWDKLDQRIIDKVVGEWRKRLQACVAVGGGPFEHKM